MAVIVKGRSSSASLNTLLRKSLPNLLGHGLYGNYGYVPSLANVADDPTRSVKIRSPQRIPIFDLKASLRGDFSSLDEWLGKVGFSVEATAGLPFPAEHERCSGLVQSLLLDPLRAVQKPERLALFDAKFSPAVSQSQVLGEDTSREHKKEPEGPTKKENKSPKRTSEKGPDKAVSCASNHLAPREKNEDKVEACSTSPSGLPRRRRPRLCHGSRAENTQLSELSAEAVVLLSQFPAAQFFCPGGRRARAGFRPRRQGYLDLYSGESGVARALASSYDTWVLTFDFCHGEEQDLLKPELQEKLLAMISSGCFWAVGAAPECCSFLRAVNPPVRGRAEPEGLPHISTAMQIKVRRGNEHAEFVLKVLKCCKNLGVTYCLKTLMAPFSG